MTPTSGAVRTSSDAAHAEIKSWILRGEIPLGMRLSEIRVAARLSVSRTPVREALLRLHAERFVERHPDGGYRVSHPRAQEMFELYDVRKALELFALTRTLAAPDSGREGLIAVRESWAALERDTSDADPDPNFVVLDEAFHADLAAVTQNTELVASLRRVSERIRPVRTHDFLLPGRIAATIEQHLAILDASLAGEARAVQLLEDHICESQRHVEGAVGRVLERMLTVREEDLTW